MKVLVVMRSFGDYAVGQTIEDKETQDKVLETHAQHVEFADHPTQQIPASPQ